MYRKIVNSIYLSLLKSIAKRSDIYVGDVLEEKLLFKEQCSFKVYSFLCLSQLSIQTQAKTFYI